MWVWLVMKRRDDGVIEHWVAKRPLTLGGPAFLFEIVAHCRERFDDGFNALAELDA